MTATSEREHIKTDNELYGSKFLDENAPGGVWLVLVNSQTGKSSYVSHLFSNRQAAEAYIHEYREETGWPLHRYSLQVWSVSETWPDEDEEDEG